MEEEVMWKTLYEKIQAEQGAKIIETEHECRIQKLDNAFFEKFGTLLDQQAKQTELVPQDGDSGVGDDTTPNVSIGEIDSEHEEPDAADLITDAMGWNIEELYSEILFEVLHNVGCDVESNDEQTQIIDYLKEAFHLEDEKHNLLLEAARAKEPPKILLNVEVIEAKDLRPKDANGLSDPFCTLYLNSAPTHRYNTSVKSETLCPLWEEHFSLPVNSPEDVLSVEVWDFDPAETVREKMTKIGEVKGVKGLRKLMKEIAVTASTGKHDNEFVGSATIPLRTIPASGQMFWCPLEKKTKTKKQGNVKVKLSFSKKKNTQVSSQEYRHLLRLLLLHELETTKVEHYHWCGNFSSLAKDILTQHVAQCGLTSTADALAQWIEFSNVHVDHPLSFVLFSNLLEKLTRSIHNDTLSEDEVKLFWEATKKLLPSCVNSIRKVRKLTSSDKSTLNQITAVLSIFSQLQTLKLPASINLFPANVYGWLSKPTEGDKYAIDSVVKEAITQGALDWYSHVVENQNEEEAAGMEGKLRHLIRIVQLVRSDIQRGIEFYDKTFQECLHLSYAQTLYTLYENKLSEMTEPAVTEACKFLKPLRFEEDLDDKVQNEMLSIGTTLFELYLTLQRFSVLGKGLCPSETSALKIFQFHQWFHEGVAQWLDIALYKAMQRIEKAAELDNLKPVDASVKYSSSAVDTLAIFYQIKIFWKQLSWPDVEGSYTFVAKIIDDICRCCVYYSDKMTQKVEGLGERKSVFEQKFEVTPEWCLAINNIDYVRNSIPTFVDELGMDEIIKTLSDFQSPSAAEHCKQTLLVMIENAIDTVANKILDLQETVAQKMKPSMNRFLMEGAELLNQESNSVDRLMQYLDENLMTLNQQLNEDNFLGILNIIWEKIALLLGDLLKNGLENRRPPSFFSNLLATLKILMDFFKKGEAGSNKQNTLSSNLANVERLLRLHSLETWELIHQYNLERLEEQNALETAELGLLTVKAQLVDNHLWLEIMNARNLHPKDSNGTCDPYVKVHLLPEEKFISVSKPRTKTQKKTSFPLFDEIFTLPLSAEQKTLPDGLVQFIIKDQDFIGKEFIGETYLDFKSIPKTDSSVNEQTLPQIHLKLSRPTKLNSDAFKALEHRQGDKLAREFIKKQKSKLTH